MWLCACGWDCGCAGTPRHPDIRIRPVGDPLPAPQLSASDVYETRLADGAQTYVRRRPAPFSLLCSATDRVAAKLWSRVTHPVLSTGAPAHSLAPCQFRGNTGMIFYECCRVPTTARAASLMGYS